MLVKGDHRAKAVGCEALEEERIGRAVTFETAVRAQPVGRSFRFHFILGFSESQRFSLGKKIRHQYVVMVSKRIQGLTEANKITWDQACTLMDELIERVLTVRSRFPPNDGRRLVVHMNTVDA